MDKKNDVLLYFILWLDVDISRYFRKLRGIVNEMKIFMQDYPRAFLTRELQIHNEWVMIINENVTHSVVPTVAQWAVNFQQILYRVLSWLAYKSFLLFQLK